MSSLEDAILRIETIAKVAEELTGKSIGELTLREILKHAHVEYIKERPQTQMPDFTEPRFNTPMIVYTIQNTQNRKVYIGKTKNTFCERYPTGAWWNKTVNEDLIHDLRKFGYANFNVNIYFCNNEEAMDSMEASLISLNWALRYNRRPEPEVE